MNKLFMVATLLVATTFASCKKDYTCSCTGAFPIEIALKDAKKKDAKDACEKAQATYSLVGATTCTLK
jgi:hypothetical protein